MWSYGGHILQISDCADTAEDDNVISAVGCVVTPGLVGHHAHFYPLVGIGIPAEGVCFSSGVTAAVDAGSTGCATYRQYRPFLEQTRLTIRPYLHVSPLGLSTLPSALEDVNPAVFDEGALRELFSEYGGELAGLKLISAKAAQERGVLFEAADARAHFGFSTAEAAISEGFWPDFIGTDLTILSMHLRPTSFNLAMQISRYVYLGIPLYEVIRRCTESRPAAGPRRRCRDTVGWSGRGLHRIPPGGRPRDVWRPALRQCGAATAHWLHGLRSGADHQGRTDGLSQRYVLINL
jgi:predicted amidohydrolase